MIFNGKSIYRLIGCFQTQYKRNDRKENKSLYHPTTMPVSSIYRSYIPNIIEIENEDNVNDGKSIGPLYLSPVGTQSET